MLHGTICNDDFKDVSLRASSPFGGYRVKYTREETRLRGAGFAARSRVRARLASLAQIGELARRL